jgi:hypothetical protein
VDDPEIQSRARDAGLADFVEARMGRALRVAGLTEVSLLPPGSVLCLDAGRQMLAVDRPSEPESVRAVVLYGLTGAVPLRTFAHLEAVLGRGRVLLSLAGRALALWNTTTALVVAASVAPVAEASLARLAGLLNDRSLDPLSLAETCARQVRALSARDEGDVARLQARTRELEVELAEMEARLLRQQRSLALYNDLLAGTERGATAATEP